MGTGGIAVAALLLPCLSLPAAAAAQATASSSVRIEERAGVTIVRDVMTQTGASLTLIGTKGDNVSVGLPGSIAVSNSVGQSLELITSVAFAYGNGLILGNDAVSVDIGATADPQSRAGANGVYGGVMVVVAQYN